MLWGSCSAAKKREKGVSANFCDRILIQRAKVAVRGVPGKQKKISFRPASSSYRRWTTTSFSDLSWHNSHVCFPILALCFDDCLAVDFVVVTLCGGVKSIPMPTIFTNFHHLGKYQKSL
jgi:hypothetical protein